MILPARTKMGQFIWIKNLRSCLTWTSDMLLAGKALPEIQASCNTQCLTNHNMTRIFNQRKVSMILGETNIFASNNMKT